MSRTLRTKLFLMGFSLTILVLVPLLESNFYAPVTMIRWRELAWDDFQGLAKPFTGWDATITSNIYVEFDSAQGNYVSYAAMNNQLSWKKGSFVKSEDLLSHEQYHFNLTEFYSRKLNQMIGVENLKQESEVQKKLIELRVQLNSWQDQYDTETDHGLHHRLQAKWEFKIDSLLSTFSPDSGYVSDYYSACRVFMPTRFIFDKGTSEGRSYAYRSYSVKKYNMFLALGSIQYFERQSTDLTDMLFRLYRRDSLEIRSISVDSSVYRYHALAETFDSVANETTFHRWVHNGNYLYKVTARYPGDSNTPEYRSIANSFVMSFETIDNRAYWTNQVELSEATMAANDIKSGVAENQESEYCWTYVHAAPVGFYGQPLFYDEGSVLIPYCVTNHADSLVQELVVFNKEKQYSYELTDRSFLYLPGEDIGNKTFSIDVGYTSYERAKNGCFLFFNQSISINPKVEP